MKLSKHKGFTLVELMITLAIAGILLAYAIPSYTDFSRRQLVSNEANDLLGDVMFARVTAIKEGQEVTITTVSGDTDWSEGWFITLDSTAVTIREKQEISGSLVLTGLFDSITFNNIGNSTGSNIIEVTHTDISKNVKVAVALSGMITTY